MSAWLLVPRFHLGTQCLEALPLVTNRGRASRNCVTRQEPRNEKRDKRCDRMIVVLVPRFHLGTQCLEALPLVSNRGRASRNCVTRQEPRNEKRDKGCDRMSACCLFPGSTWEHNA
jgi:hypothetical protein